LLSPAQAFQSQQRTAQQAQLPVAQPQQQVAQQPQQQVELHPQQEAQRQLLAAPLHPKPLTCLVAAAALVVALVAQQLGVAVAVAAVRWRP
jgi:Tfp pilus assembly protein PilP